MDQFEKPISYAVKHKDERVRAASRSGGIFTALSDYVLEQEGTVYGCVLDEDFSAVHYRAVSKADRDRMHGSKYIQSAIGDTFKEAKADLEAGKEVLFSGTSCEIAGLRGYLKKEYEKLLCVDIVCHGVPSPAVWQEYLEWSSKGRKITSVDFRNKTKYGWADHVETLYFDNGDSVDSRVYTKLFYGHSVLRPSCYKCPYKSIIHPGDITIADYWGIGKASPGFDDNKGVSLVMINNERGKRSFEKVISTIDFIETDMKNSMQPPLIAPFPRPANRDQFWKDFHTKRFHYIVKKYTEDKLLTKVKRKVKNIAKKANT